MTSQKIRVIMIHFVGGVLLICCLSILFLTLYTRTLFFDHYFSVEHVLISVDADQPKATLYFGRLMGFSPPESVSGIYYAKYLSRDIRYLLRFHCRDSNVLKNIIGKYNLQKEIEFGFASTFDNPKWWLAAEQLSGIGIVYQGTESGISRSLWVDASGVVYYQYIDL